MEKPVARLAGKLNSFRLVPVADVALNDPHGGNLLWVWSVKEFLAGHLAGSIPDARMFRRPMGGPAVFVHFQAY